MRLPPDLLVPQLDRRDAEQASDNTYIANLRDRLSQVWTSAKRNIEKDRVKIAARREKEVNALDIKEGDAVLCRDKHSEIGKARKLLPKWTGLWNVLRVTDTDAQIQLVSKPDTDPKYM